MKTENRTPDLAIACDYIGELLLNVAEHNRGNGHAAHLGVELIKIRDTLAPKGRYALTAEAADLRARAAGMFDSNVEHYPSSCIVCGITRAIGAGDPSLGILAPRGGVR